MPRSSLFRRQASPKSETKKLRRYTLDNLIEDLEHVDCSVFVPEMMLKPLGWDGSTIYISGSTIKLLPTLIEKKAFQAARVLIQECNLRTSDASAALLRVCATPCEEQSAMVNLLLDHGACAEAKDEQGRTALHIAYESKSSTRIMSHIAIQANVNHTNHDGNTVLHVALHAADSEAVRMLLRHGANANQLDGAGQLPLVLAARHENDTCFQLLQRFGARIEDVNDDDAWTLMKSPEAALILLQRGFSSDIVNAEGVAPLHTAFAQWCVWSSLARQEDDFHALLFQGDAKSLVDLLLAAASDVNATDTKGCTALHHACKVNHTATLQFVQGLVAKGANVNVADLTGATPLHAALACGNYATAITLLQLGADVTAVDSLGRSPMHVATGTGDEASCAQLVNLSLHKGFDFRSVDHDGNLPFFAAANDTLQFAMVQAAACQGLFR